MIGLKTELIAQILLDFAPPEGLEGLDLSEETKQKWIASREAERQTRRGASRIVDLSALALYYATRKYSGWRKRAGYGRIEIDLLTLGKLAEMAKIDEFDATEAILNELKQEAGRKRIKKAQSVPRPTKHNWEKVAELVAELLASERSERQLSGIVKRRLGVPPSTFREWRRKTTALYVGADRKLTHPAD